MERESSESAAAGDTREAAALQRIAVETIVSPDFDHLEELCPFPRWSLRFSADLMDLAAKRPRITWSFHG